MSSLKKLEDSQKKIGEFTAATSSRLSPKITGFVSKNWKKGRSFASSSVARLSPEVKNFAIQNGERAKTVGLMSGSAFAGYIVGKKRKC